MKGGGTQFTKYLQTQHAIKHFISSAQDKATMFHRYASWMIRLSQYTKAQQHQTTPSPIDHTQITKAVLKCAYIFSIYKLHVLKRYFRAKVQIVV